MENTTKKTQTENEVNNCRVVLGLLSLKGNSLASTVSSEFSKNYIQENYDSFSIRFYFKENCASWGTHQIKFESESNHYLKRKSGYSLEQFQLEVSDCDLTKLEVFTKDLHEIFKALLNDYKSRTSTKS